MADNTKQQVRDFYDQIGWSQAGVGLYQNARYEDLRPVAREYIHRCHLRVNRYIDTKGDMLLDAGSGPVQWPEYLTYSFGYRYRVCADLSITALKEARQRLGVQGLYVIADIAHLPFKEEAFDAVVSLHTIHHLPAEEHRSAYSELYRVLKPGRRGAAVNGWGDSLSMRLTSWLAGFLGRETRRTKRGIGDGRAGSKNGRQPSEGLASTEKCEGEALQRSAEDSSRETPTGTYVHKTNAEWLRAQLEGMVPIEIRPWRSVGTHFTRTFIHQKAGGKYILRFIYWLEERFPRFLGEEGQYPIVAFKKPAAGRDSARPLSRRSDDELGR